MALFTVDAFPIPRSLAQIDRPTSFNASRSAAPGQGHGLQYSHAFHAHGGPFTGTTCVFSTRVEWMKRREVVTGYVRNSDLDIEDLELLECGLGIPWYERIVCEDTHESYFKSLLIPAVMRM